MRGSVYKAKAVICLQSSTKGAMAADMANNDKLNIGYRLKKYFLI